MADTEQMNVRVPQGMSLKVSDAAWQVRMSKNAWLAAAISEKLERQLRAAS